MVKGLEETFPQKRCIKMTNKHKKRCSNHLLFKSSHILKEMQIKTTVRYCSLLAIVQKQTTKKITSVSKDVVNLESLLTLGRNVKWCSLCRNQYDGSYKLKTELPYDTEIPLLGLCPKMNESSLQEICIHCLYQLFSQ